MKMHQIVILGLLAMGSTQVSAKEAVRLLEAPRAIKSWITQQGYPHYLMARSGLVYHGEKGSLSVLEVEGEDLTISQSPLATYAVVRSLGTMSAVKAGRRAATYTILNGRGELQYRINEYTSADLKPMMASVSDAGHVALLDPVSGVLKFYQEDDLISENQILGTGPDLSMERNSAMGWIQDFLVIAQERPGFNGAPGEFVEVLTLDHQGRIIQRVELPFRHLQANTLAWGRRIFSGYNYDPATTVMDPWVIELADNGSISWSLNSFAHEISLSSNHEFLAILSSHELIQTINLRSRQVARYEMGQENKAALGLAVNDRGAAAVIRVPFDFFVKQNSYSAEIVFPADQSKIDLELDPHERGLFKLHSYADRIYVGTSYEWLELTP